MYACDDFVPDSMSRKPLIYGGITSIALGAMCRNPTHAIGASMLAGAAMPYLTRTPVTATTVLASMLSSAAMGALSNNVVHHSFTKKVEKEKEGEQTQQASNAIG